MQLRSVDRGLWSRVTADGHEMAVVVATQVREARDLDIEVSHALSMGLDEPLARQHFVAH